MFFVWSLVFFFIWDGSNARIFNNPVIETADNPDPGVVLYNGQYYAVTTTSENSVNLNKFPIYVSKDLQNWDLKGYVFDETNLPTWATNKSYWAPEMYIFGERQFRVYFTARDNQTQNTAVGVAHATNILGPYTALDEPLVRDTERDVLDATVVFETENSTHLLWKRGEWMYGAQLNSDGLSMATTEQHQILQNDLPWEGAIVEAPWVVKRNGTLYMFYSGSEYCTDKYAVGVAKSDSFLGPWIKKGDPILVSDDDFKGPGHCSVVKDIDGVSDVMVYHAYLAGEVCHPYPRLMMAQSVAWGPDGWPYMTKS